MHDFTGSNANLISWDNERVDFKVWIHPWGEIYYFKIFIFHPRVNRADLPDEIPRSLFCASKRFRAFVMNYSKMLSPSDV